jgi:hypothetical protein
MADADVRAALVTYLTGLNIPGIQQWYDDEPWIIQGNTWNLDAGYGALAFVHIDDVVESRATLPYKTGQVRVDYTVSLLIMYQYVIPPTAQAGSEDAWVGPLDTIIGATKAGIRADQNAGNPAVIWQWGQEPQGIRHQRDLPVRNAGRIQSWNRIIVAATEIITA